MRHFIYTYSETKPPRDGSGAKKTVNVYEIENNIPRQVATRTESFVNEFQLVLNALEENAILPAFVFERNPHNSARIYGSEYSLEQAGIAKISRID